MKLFIVFLIFSISGLCLSQTYPVEFRVNMSIQLASGKFDPASDKIVIRGNFQTDAGDVSDWSGTMFECKDEDNDSIYTFTINLPSAKAGASYEYKYVIIKNGVDNWESISNRTFILTGPVLMLLVVFFNDIFKMPKELAITFVCNMEYEIAVGKFDPAYDSLFVSGDFNGWSAVEMKSILANSNYYYADLFFTIEEGQTINYKFAYKKNNNTIWENDPNKTYTFSEADYRCEYALVYRTFNNPEDLDLHIGYDFTIKFTVDMDSAKSSYGNSFDKIENVVLAGSEMPLQWPSPCWPESDYQQIFYLKDDGTNGDLIAGDNTWSRDIKFDKYSQRIIQYRYAANFDIPNSTEACNDNEARKLKRNYNHFIILPNDIISATVRDTFGIMGYKPVYDLVTVDVNESRIRNYSFSLEQNFPNPFNPSTTISYEIAEPGFVSLKIYNTLGQEVETLVNEFKNVGSYNVEWSVSNNHLSSGVYFYQLTQGSNIIIKKMILLR